jgi:hypothetical protein
MFAELTETRMEHFVEARKLSVRSPASPEQTRRESHQSDAHLNLSDVWTCYKAFRGEVLATMELRENRFGFEQEITAKVARKRLRIYEVPISYFGRTYAEGKKITWKDGVRGIWCIVRCGLFD